MWEEEEEEEVTSLKQCVRLLLLLLVVVIAAASDLVSGCFPTAQGDRKRLGQITSLHLWTNNFRTSENKDAVRGQMTTQSSSCAPDIYHLFSSSLDMFNPFFKLSTVSTLTTSLLSLFHYYPIN